MRANVQHISTYLIYHLTIQTCLSCSITSGASTKSARLWQVYFVFRRLASRGENTHYSDYYRRSPGSRPGQSIWDLSLTKWHCGRLFSDFFGLSLPIKFHCGSLYSCIIWETNNRPAGGLSSGIVSLHRHEQHSVLFLMVSWGRQVKFRKSMYKSSTTTSFPNLLGSLNVIV